MRKLLISYKTLEVSKTMLDEYFGMDTLFVKNYDEDLSLEITDLIIVINKYKNATITSNDLVEWAWMMRFSNFYDFPDDDKVCSLMSEIIDEILDMRFKNFKISHCEVEKWIKALSAIK